jgi:predicted metalloprotease with PDZ domain
MPKVPVLFLAFLLVFFDKSAQIAIAQTSTPSTDSGPRAWSSEPVTLRIKPVIQDGKFRALDMAYEFVAPQRDKLVLRLPDEWGGETGLYRSLTDLRADGASITPGDNASLRNLTLKPGAKIIIRYRISHNESIARKPNDYHPIIRPDYFHLIGFAVVPRIDGMWLGSPAQFVLEDFPKTLSFASDLEHQSLGKPLNVLGLAQSVLVGGDFRVFDAGNGARIAIRGHWSRSDDQWRTQFSRIAGAQRQYWNSTSEPYLVTILDLTEPSQGRTSVGGTGLSDAFAFYATTNANLQDIDQAMSHEMMHTWIPQKIGNLPIESEQLTYWLSEGFTDWAAWRTMVRANLLDINGFFKAFNESLMANEISPARNVSNQVIFERFWVDDQVRLLPYQRGMLIATYWDAIVRKNTANQFNFDDVLRNMQRSAFNNPKASGMAVEYLRAAMLGIANHDITVELTNFINAGQDIPLREDSFGVCGDLKTTERKVFHRGFDVQATQKANNEIKGVVIDGPAYLAGLRDGMKLIGRSAGVIGESRIEIAYDIQDGEIKKTLRWMPEGKANEKVREFVVKKSFTPDERTACLARIGAN